MALGGGTWTNMNKILPGAYINVISAKRAEASTGDRGVSAIAYESDFGVSNEIMEITADEFERDCLVRFGYKYEDDKLKNLRELFRHSKKAFLYRLDKGGVKASNTYATAKYTGTRGNNILIKISANVDVPSQWDVSTLLDGVRVDKQTVANAKALKNNAFVDFKTDATLKAEAGVPLTNGANGSAITGTEHQAFLKAVEPYNFNSLGCISADETTKKLYVAFTKRMRDEVGVKFQTIVHNYAQADYEGVISIKNNTKPDLVYWVTGANAGCKIEESLTNMNYDGEYKVDVDLTQTELENCIRNGELVFHRVGQETHILKDINTLTTFTSEKGEDFSTNKVIRVVDALAEETAHIFNTEYNGECPNDDDGRVDFWNKIYSKLKEYNLKRAIQKPVADDVKVTEGDDATSVYLETHIRVIQAMEKLYAVIKVS